MPLFIDKAPKDAKDFTKSSTEPRAIPATEYAAYQRNFTERFAYQNENVPVSGGDQFMMWAELERVAFAFGAPNGKKAVVVYLGVLNDALVYGFRIVGLRFTSGRLYDLLPTIDTGDPGERPTHYLKQDGTLGDIGEIDWPSAKAQYTGSVLVDHESNGTYVKVNHSTAKDPKAIVFPWQDEMQLLYLHNLSEMVGFNPWVRISSIGMIHSDVVPTGFRHGMGFNMGFYDGNGDWFDVLSSGSAILPSAYIYKGMAADLGNRCPPRCKEYESPV